MKYTDCSNEWLREVIQGKITFRKCPSCDNEGIEIQSYDENGEPCNSDDETAQRYTCENCEGVAYIEIPQ